LPNLFESVCSRRKRFSESTTGGILWKEGRRLRPFYER
jgi:hypothetical protein